MAKLVVLYKQPADPKAFDDYYFDKHVPLAKTIPGLKHYAVSDGMVASPAGASPYHLVAMLDFASLADIQTAFASPEGRAAAADVGTFAQAGVEMLMFETREV